MSKLTNEQRELLKRMDLLDSYKERRVLITGATGFVGEHLCEALFDLGAEVYALSRSAMKHNFSIPLTAYSVDLKNLGQSQKIISLIKPEIVFHLAGYVNTSQELMHVMPTIKNNLLSSVNLLLALSQIGCQRVIITSSSEEPDVSHLGNFPVSPYAASKDALTSYSRMFYNIFSTPVVIARPFMCYGPRQSHKKVIPYTISNFLNNRQPLLSSGKRICDLIYIQDLVMGLILIGIRSNLVGRIIDLGTGMGTSIYDVAQIIKELTNSFIDPIFGAIPDRLYENPQIADIRNLEFLLGYKPFWDLRMGLELTIQWYRSNRR